MEEEYDGIEEEHGSYRFTPKGLQHLIDRANLRYSLAVDDDEEHAMCLAEILALYQLVYAYGWEVDNSEVVIHDV